MKDELIKAVATRCLVFDGAMGTMLQAAGLPAGTPPELWNIEHPARVATVHRAYVEAGAELIETNTFGSSPAKLSLHGLADRADECNRAGVELARQAVGDQAWVVGSMGPVGALLAPFGDLELEEADASFHAHAAALAAAGADAINIETMSDLVELRLAIVAALATGLPVMAEVVLAQNGRTLYGSPPEVVGAYLAGFPLTAAGVNCGLTPAALAPYLPELRSAWTGPTIAQPNAGQPGDYLGPGEFASAAAALAESGATLLGGCCGTTPEHIARLRRELAAREMAPVPAGPISVKMVASRTQARVLESLSSAPVVAVTGEDQDLFQAAQPHGQAAAIVFDLTRVAMSPSLLGRLLAALWPALGAPVVFLADRDEILAAAITSYPGRPGASGPQALSGTARRLGALWLGD